MALKKRKYPSGKIVWIAEYRDIETGAWRYKTIGEVDKHTAELVWKDMQAKLVKAKFGIQSLEEQRKIKLTSFAEEFLGYSQATLSPKTYELDKAAFGQALDYFGNCYLTNITVHKIEKWKQELSKIQSKTTISMRFRRLQAAFNIAIKWKYLKENPFNGVSKATTFETKRADFLSKEEVERLLEVIKDEKYRRLIEFYLHTGCRRNEALYLEWTDINFERHKIEIRSKPEYGHRTKFQRQRSVPMSDKLEEVLRSIPQKDSFVFSDYQRTPDNVNRRLKRYLAKAGINRHLSLHNLRHTFASHLAMQGVSLHIIGNILGHSHVNTTEIYAHLLPDELQPIVNRIPY